MIVGATMSSTDGMGSWTRAASVDLGTSDGFASLQGSAEAWHEEVKRRQSEVDIHRWEQAVHSFRTQVTSLHHNICATLSETFAPSWRPENGSEPVWLLGRRYEAYVAGGDCSNATSGYDTLGVTEIAVASASSSSPRRPNTLVAATSDAAAIHGGRGDASCGSPDDFFAAWSQISRMTYRKGFTPMYRCVRNPSSSSDERAQYIRLTSDAGWGCMIRVGQMLLATTLKRLRTDERVISTCGTGNSTALHQLSDVERQFLDDPRPERSLFSIFEFIRAAYGREVTDPDAAAGACSAGASSPRSGACTDLSGSFPPPPHGSCASSASIRSTMRQLTEKKPGDWFGPTTVSETIAALVEQTPELRGSLAVYVDPDGVLYEDEVRALGHGFDDTSSSVVWPEPTAVPALRPSPPPTVTRDDRIQSSRGQKAPCTRESSTTGGGPVSMSTAFAMEDEFEMVSTASVNSPSAWGSPTCSPSLEILAAPRPVSATSCDPSTSLNKMISEKLSEPCNVLQESAADSNGEFEEAHGEHAGVMTSSFCNPPEALPILPPPAIDDEIDDLACSGTTSMGDGTKAAIPERWNRSVLLLFPLQLGIEKHVSDAHTTAVLRYFELAGSLGAMGGRPRMAHFFVGRRGHGLLYVDPHFVQPAAVSSSEDEDCDKFEHFRNHPTVQTIPVEHIDSSISFAFYCQSEADLQQLIAGIHKVEAEEANAPIRAESTRPLALRSQGPWRCMDDSSIWQQDGPKSIANPLLAASSQPTAFLETDFRTGGESWSECDASYVGHGSSCTEVGGAHTDQRAEETSTPRFVSPYSQDEASEDEAELDVDDDTSEETSESESRCAPNLEHEIGRPTSQVLLPAAACEDGNAFSGVGEPRTASVTSGGSLERSICVGKPWAMIEDESFS